MIKKIVLSVMLILVIMPVIIYAFDPNITDVEAEAPENLENLAVKILSTLQWVGYAIAIGMIIYIGIKYTMAAADTKANLKQAAINYIVGAIIVAGCTGILSFTIQMFESAESTKRIERVVGGDESCSHNWQQIHFDSRLNSSTSKCTSCGATKIEQDKTE